MEPIAVVSISGGKDSTATALLAIERYGHERVRLVHADTGNEHELTESYVREYLPRRLNMPVDIVKADFTADFVRRRRYIAEKWPAKGISAEVIERALSVMTPTGNPFLDLCLFKGRFPSRMAQFCTQELKRRPLDRYMLGLISQGRALESWQGVRRDESERRRDALEREPAAEGWTIVRPIVDWSAAQTVEYVLAHGVELNPLYSLGCSRVGCMLCINAGKDEISNAARRWPHHIDKIREWETLVNLASKSRGASFFHHHDADGTDNATAYEICRIDNMVSWAMTTRGGRQYDLLKVGEPETCSSSYGLCE